MRKCANLVDEAHRRCHEILTSYEDRLDAVAAALLEQETLHAPEFEAIMRGRKTLSRQLMTWKPGRPVARRHRNTTATSGPVKKIVAIRNWT